MRLLLAALLAALCLPSECNFYEGTLKEDITINNKYIKTLYRLLNSECPSYTKSKRELVHEFDQHHLEVQQATYNWLMEKLIECKRSKNKVTEKTTSTTIRTTTVMMVPKQCLMAVNRTEAWRKYDEKNGGNSPKTGVCDINTKSSVWFRFSGKAGNKMLSSCPKYSGCGADISFWTNARMPKEVGVEAKVAVYGQRGDNCKDRMNSVRVMRCSDKSGDFIYRINSNQPRKTCNRVFCGMK